MCNCINESEEKILEHFKKRIADKEYYSLDEIKSGHYTNAVFQFSNGLGGKMTKRMTNHFELTGTKANKKGVSRTIKKTISITPNFCCFCGKKLE
jgi:hypothetical protein